MSYGVRDMNKEAMKKLGVKAYDTADHLRDDEEAKLYLLACIEEAGADAAFIAKALGTVARSRVAMAEVATKTGLSRESLYKALSGERDPSFSTILKVSAALGLRLTFTSSTAVPAKTNEFELRAVTAGNQPLKQRLFALESQIPSKPMGIENRAPSGTNQISETLFFDESQWAFDSVNHAESEILASAWTSDSEIDLTAPEFGMAGMAATAVASSGSFLNASLLSVHPTARSLLN